MNYFLFKKNGKIYDTRDYGIVCGAFPPIVHPRKRVEIESIPGRNGSLISTDNCYDSYTKTIECAMEDKIVDLSWLSDSGKLVLSNELDFEYDVTIKNNIELEQIATYYRNFLINFETQPFKKSVKDFIIEKTEKEFNFEVGGDTYSYPIIEVTGTGTITLTINGSTFKINDLNDTIIIDSELLVVMENNQNALNKTIGEFPILIPGNNIVQITGDMTNIKIKYKDTFL